MSDRERVYVVGNLKKLEFGVGTKDMIHGLKNQERPSKIGRTLPVQERLAALADGIRQEESRVRKLQLAGISSKDLQERFLLHEELLKHSTVLYRLRELFWDEI